MAYCAKADLEARYGATEVLQLTDRDNSGTEDAGVLDAVIADVDAYIDAFLAARYTTPISPVPDAIKAAACEIVRYRLYDDRATDEVRRRFEDARDFLTDIRDGKAQLASDPDPATDGAAYGTKDDDDRVFTMSGLAGFGS